MLNNTKIKQNKILVTGCSGFIGFHVAKTLLDRNFQVCGIDNMNNYYDQKLKRERLKILKKKRNFKFFKIDICDTKKINNLFKKSLFIKVVHLAAQAGVRYSLKNPKLYLKSNILGFGNILEACRLYNCKHLVFASSSSVYGSNKNIPFNETDRTDNPIQLYAATKKSNEIMAHAYSHLYKLSITGLRFFTVYGPWGRPDMAIYSFTKKILKNETVEIYNNGNHYRDFTYVSDISDGIILALKKKNKGNKMFEIFNIGNSNPVNILDCLNIIEKNLGKMAKIKFQLKQPGDMVSTYSNTKKIRKKFKFITKVKLDEGIKKFVLWFKNYNKLK